MTSSPIFSPPGRCLLLAPMRAELDPVAARWGLEAQGDLLRGRVGEQEVVAGCSGVGAENAVAALKRLLEQQPCDSVIFFGFAGALDPALTLGNVIQPKWVIDGAGGCVTMAGDIPRVARESDRPAGEQALLSVRELIDSPIRKRRLQLMHRASAVDMESYAVARFAAQHGVALQIIRAISDTAQQVLPTAAAQWVGPDGATRMMPAMVWLLQHPWRLPELLRLQHGAALAGEALAEALGRRLAGQGDTVKVKA